MGVGVGEGGETGIGMQNKNRLFLNFKKVNLTKKDKT